MTQKTQLILDLIDLVAEERIAELHVREPAFSVRVQRRAGGPLPVPALETIPPPEKPSPGTTATSHKVCAPMAGTFYRASRPGGEPLAREGSWTAAGAPLCVIEAMKMMTEVAAEAGGTIVRALCEDGQTVEQGQALFIIEPGEAPHVS